MVILMINGEPPKKPPEMNGEHEQIWDFLWYINDKIDRLTWIATGAIILAVAANAILRAVMQ